MNSRRPVNSTVRAHRSFKNHKRNARLVARARRAANVDVRALVKTNGVHAGRASRSLPQKLLALRLTMGRRSNKSLDRSGGCAFCIIIGPARLE